MVTLIFELVFFGSLALVKQKAEHERNQAKQSREVSRAAQILSYSFYELEHTFSIYQTGRDPSILKAYESRAERTRDLQALFEGQLDKDSRYSKRSRRTSLLGDQLLEALEVMRYSITSGADGDALPMNLKVVDQMKYVAQELIAELNSLSDEERGIGAAAAKSAADLERLLVTIFWCGVVASVLLTVALTVKLRVFIARQK